MGQWLRLCAPNAGGPRSIPGQRMRSHMPQLKTPNAAKRPCEAKKKRHEFLPHANKCQAAKQAQPSPTAAISLAGGTPRTRSSVNTSTDLSGQEVGGREGVQLISAEQWNVLGNLCAQEDRTLPRGLYLLELRLTIPRQKPEQPLRRNSRLRAEPTFVGVISLFQL